MALLNRVRKVLGGEPLPSRWRWATGAVLVAPLALWSIVLAGELLWATTEKPPVEAPRVVDQATTAIAEPFDPFGADTAASKSSESSPFGARYANEEPVRPSAAVDDDGFGSLPHDVFDREKSSDEPFGMPETAEDAFGPPALANPKDAEIERLKRENAELREALMMDIAGRSTLISPLEADKSLGVLQAETKSEPAKVVPKDVDHSAPELDYHELRKEYEQLLERQIEELERLGEAYRENPVPGKDPHDLDRQRLEAIEKLLELRGSKSSSASRSATEKPIDPPPAPVEGGSLSVTFRDGGKLVDVSYWDHTLNAEVKIATTPDELPALLERIAPRLGRNADALPRRVDPGTGKAVSPSRTIVPPTAPPTPNPNLGPPTEPVPTNPSKTVPAPTGTAPRGEPFQLRSYYWG